MATQTLTAPPRLATTSPCETTLLGQTYSGRPMGLALQMSNLEQAGNADKARALLDAHNRIRSAFGQQPYDLAADFTEIPMEGGFTIQAVPTVTIMPRPLNERLWELVGKEMPTLRTTTKITAARKRVNPRTVSNTPPMGSINPLDRYPSIPTELPPARGK